MKSVGKIGLFIISLFILFNCSLTLANASHKTLIENFDDGNDDGWIVTRNPCFYNGQPAQWQVINGKLNIKINSFGCVTEIIPNDALWNNLGNDYSVEFDETIISGTDHNFAFRYNNPNQWIDIHIVNPNTIGLQRLPIGGSPTNTEIHTDVTNGQTIHFRIDVKGENVKVYKNHELNPILDYNPNDTSSTSGRIALQASSGSTSETVETYFDNIVVTSIDDIQLTPTPTPLNVPLFKQTDPKWNLQTYDGAKKWSAADPTINTWGCALTSAAMVLKFYGYNKIDKKTGLDPGTLNKWLNAQSDGYVGNGLLNWLAISRFSKSKLGLNNLTGFDALEYHRAGVDINQLTTDITQGRPDILEEPGHFVVAKGITNTSFAINDPYYDRTDLVGAYNNTFLSLGRYTPSFTDLSYIMLVTDPSLSFVVKDKNGNVLGTSFIQQPIVDPADSSKNSGPAKKITYIEKPSTGNYQIVITGINNSVYNLDTYLYDINGEVNKDTISGIFKNGTDTITIAYDKNNLGKSKRYKISTFQSIIDDITILETSKDIKKIKMKNDLILLIQKAEELTKAKKIKNDELKQKFNNFIEDIKHQKGKEITETAYQVLIYDISYLKSLYFG